MKEYILVVDDSSTVRAAASFALKEKGFTVQTAEHGLDGLQKLEDIFVAGEKTAMIISDINMPEMDGLTFLHVVKKSPFKEIPFLILSTEGQKSMKQKGKDGGAVGWLTKPFTPDQLAKVIMKFVSIEVREENADDQLFEIFSKEVSGLLPEIERGLEGIDSFESEPNKISSLIRTLHYIRTSAFFVGCGELSRYIYNIAEKTLIGIKDKNIKLSREIIDIMVGAFALIKKMIEGKSYSIKDIEQNLSEFENKMKMCVSELSVS
ncbi:response regulator [Thermodesulfobacteriota bacterium]